MKRLTRTEQIDIDYNDTLSNLCHISKSLWNEANYFIRQTYFGSDNNVRIQYHLLDKFMKDGDNYQLLPAQTSQQTLKLLDKAWKGHYEATKEYYKDPSKFLGRPRYPGYKDKDGETLVVFTNQQCHLKDGYLILPKTLKLSPIKTRLKDKVKLRQVRIIPKGEGYICEIVYKKRFEPNKKLNPKRILGIDYGTANVVTKVNNIGRTPIVYKDDGMWIKSTNQFYNKKKAELQSIYDKQGIKYGSAMSRLNTKRNLKMKDAMHKLSRHIIDKCVKRKIGTIVIGSNSFWKQNIDIGRRNNQNFVSIPFYQLTQMIQYKAKEVGINVILQQESYTSKCSFLDMESIKYHSRYKGKRVSRALFKSKKGITIHSDVNGAYNIIRKAKPNAFTAKDVGGCGLHPIKVTL